jgi:hypothetical protein
VPHDGDDISLPLDEHFHVSQLTLDVHTATHGVALASLGPAASETPACA